MVKKIMIGLVLFFCVWVGFNLYTHKQEYLEVDGKEFVLDGKVYKVYGNAPLIEDYYLIQGVPVN